MDIKVSFVTVFIIAGLALMAGIRFKLVTMRQATIAVLALSYIVYGFIEYSKGAFSLSVVICLSSLLFVGVGLPMLLVMFALDKWMSKQNRE